MKKNRRKKSKKKKRKKKKRKKNKKKKRRKKNKKMKKKNCVCVFFECLVQLPEDGPTLYVETSYQIIHIHNRGCFAWLNTSVCL
jgi:hypothetical protein